MFPLEFAPDGRVPMDATGWVPLTRAAAIRGLAQRGEQEKRSQDPHIWCIGGFRAGL